MSDDALKLVRDKLRNITLFIVDEVSMVSNVTLILQSLPGNEIRLIAIDTVDCPTYLRQKVSKKLEKCSDDSTVTAGLENVIIIKIGCKIMLRRNIDVTLSLVNGSIGTVSSVKYSIDQCNVVDTINIKFDDGKEQVLEKVSSKFQVLDKVFVIR